MNEHAAEEGAIGRLRRQRNLCAALAVCSVASIGLALPHRVSSYRELKAVNEHLIELQAAIVQNQQQTRDAQAQILQVQREMAKRMER